MLERSTMNKIKMEQKITKLGDLVTKLLGLKTKKLCQKILTVRFGIEIQFFGVYCYQTA